MSVLSNSKIKNYSDQQLLEKFFNIIEEESLGNISEVFPSAKEMVSIEEGVEANIMGRNIEKGDRFDGEWITIESIKNRLGIMSTYAVSKYLAENNFTKKRSYVDGELSKSFQVQFK